MVLTIYGALASPCVRPVINFCELHNIPYQMHNISLKEGEQRSEAFQKINPFGTIPAIENNGYTLWEAAAIVVYLADAFSVDSQFYPKDIKKRGRINAYLNWHHQNTRFICRQFYYNSVIGPVVYGLPRASNEELEVHRQNVIEFLTRIDKQLEGGVFIADQLLTIADLFALDEILCLRLTDFDFSPFPNINRWIDEVCSNPIVRKNLAALEGMIKMVKGSN